MYAHGRRFDEGNTISEPSHGTLEEALVAAAVHDRLDRIPVWRDHVAAFGIDAVDAVAPWVGDADLDLFRFANRVIKAVALSGGSARAHAIGALTAIGRTEIPDENRRDLELVLGELEVTKMPRPGNVRARALIRGDDVLPAGEREATVIHGRMSLPDGRPAIRFTVMAQAAGSHFGVPIAARAELRLNYGDPVYLEVRRTGRFMPTTGTPGEVVFTGETTMRSGSEVYRKQADESTRGLEGIGANEVIEVLVARPRV